MASPSSFGKVRSRSAARRFRRSVDLGAYRLLARTHQRTEGHLEIANRLLAEARAELDQLRAQVSSPVSISVPVPMQVEEERKVGDEEELVIVDGAVGGESLEQVMAGLSLNNDADVGEGKVKNEDEGAVGGFVLELVEGVPVSPVGPRRALWSFEELELLPAPRRIRKHRHGGGGCSDPRL